MHLVRVARDENERTLHALVLAIIRTWNRLKQLRLDQGFTSTPHAIIVHQVSAAPSTQK